MATLAAALINLVSARETRLSSSSANTPNPQPRQDFALPPRKDLVNRVAEIEEAIGKLRAGEAMVAIEGEVGVGKSATATELAYCLQQHEPFLRDGDRRYSFVWIDCQDRCPTLTEFSGSLSALTDDRSLSAVAGEEKFDAIRAHLAEHPTVLLIDNLRLADDTTSKALIRLLESVPPSSIVIASINSPGTLAAPRIRLGDLKPSEARDLISREIQRQGLLVPDVEHSDLADSLIELFGGNPYLITSFLDGLDGSPFSIEQRLEAARRGEGAEGMLADRIAALASDALSILAACAFLRGNAIASQLGVATMESDQDVALLLTDLMSAGLVTSVRVKGGPNIFTCGVGVRNAILATTSGEEIKRFTKRLAQHYIDRFSTEWEDATGAIPHVGTLTVVAEQLYLEEEAEELHALFVAVLDILFTLGKLDDRITIATLAYKSAVRDGNYQRAARASASRTMNCAIRGELERAQESLGHGLIAARESGSPAEIARQMRVRAYVAYRSKQPEQALAMLEGADELAAEDEDLHILVDLQDLRAACYWYLGQFDLCEIAADAHEKLADEIPWERVKAYPLQMRAEVAMHCGEFAKAAELLGQSRAIATEYRDQRMLVRIAISEARRQLVGGRPAVGRDIAMSAAARAKRIGLREEAREAEALRRALRWAALPPVRLYYRRQRPQRLTDAPLAGD
ncbi:MAG TPA: ATP-binding protein [Solirubrobacterales bacterium]|nr:ATP-binding protein [Solirubrobacterales bacterium]